MAPFSYVRRARAAQGGWALLLVSLWLRAAFPTWAQTPAPPPAIQKAEQLLLAPAQNPEGIPNYPVTAVRLALLRRQPEKALEATPRIWQQEEWRKAMLAIVDTAKSLRRRPNTAQVLQTAFDQAAAYSDATSRADVITAIAGATAGLPDTTRAAALRRQARIAVRALPDLLSVFINLLEVASAEYKAGHPAVSADIVAEAQPLIQPLIAADPSNIGRTTRAMMRLADPTQQMVLCEELVEIVRRRPGIAKKATSAYWKYRTVTGELSRFCARAELPALLEISRKSSARSDIKNEIASYRAELLYKIIERICQEPYAALPPGTLEAAFQQMTTLADFERAWILEEVYKELQDAKDPMLRATALDLAYQTVQSITSCQHVRTDALVELAEAYELPDDSAQVTAILREVLRPVRLYSIEAADDKPCRTDSLDQAALLVRAAQTATQLPTPYLGVRLLQHARELTPAKSVYALQDAPRIASLLGDSAQVRAQLPWLAGLPKPATANSRPPTPPLDRNATIAERLAQARAQSDSIARLVDLKWTAWLVRDLNDSKAALAWLHEILAVPVAPTQHGAVVEEILDAIDRNIPLQNSSETPVLLAACEQLIRREPRPLFRGKGLTSLARTYWIIGKPAKAATYLREAVGLLAAPPPATGRSAAGSGNFAESAHAQTIKYGEWDTALMAAQIGESANVELLWKMVEAWYKRN